VCPSSGNFWSELFMHVQGDIVRQLGDVDLATFCLCQLAQLGYMNGQNLSAFLLSLVFSSLKSYDQVHSDLRLCFLLFLE